MGQTPNRFYPYPDPTDPTDFPGDLQALAEAVDDDLNKIELGIETRPYFRVSSDTTILFGSGATLNLPFDVLEANTSGAVGDSITPGQTNFIPLIAGLWEFTTTVSYQARLSITTTSLRLFAPTEVAGTSTNIMPSNETATMSCSGVWQMTGTGIGNSVFAVLTPNAAGTTATWPVGARSLTGVLLART